ncbi:MAG: YsnF/AvaK domain-containing protein [Gaiellaceae bacterium]
MNEGTGSGGGSGRPAPVPDGEPSLVRHEEEARLDTRWDEVGHARVRREVTSRRVTERHPRQLEELAHERVPAADDDSGEIEVLPDGSVSIPLFEEELVVTRRQVLRERVVIRKELVTDWETVDVELRREHVAFETDDAA